MSAQVIQAQVRRSNIQRFLISLIGLLFAGVMIVLFSGPYFIAKFTGPTPIELRDVALMDENSATLYFREVTGEDFIDSGFYEYTYDEDTGRTVSTDAYFGLLRVKTDWLLVRTPDEIDESVTTYVGGLTPITDSIARDVAAELRGEGISLLPVMLDTVDNDIMWYIGGGVLLIVGGLSLWGMVTVLQRMANPAKHSIFKGLSRFGDVQRVIQSIEQDLSQATTVHKLQLGRHWVLYAKGGVVHAAPYADLVWLYKHGTSSRYGTNYSAQFRDKQGGAFGIQARQKQVDAMLQAVYERAPWAIAGHNPDVQNAWSKDRQALVNAVEQRKTQLGVPVPRPLI